ncbi:hypothetical protein GGS21DRAFT_415038 [Xylaria nigripes]|nr:hypothetical protein GGS21DRAFT_415038 [Xylaria nigripes]
MSHDTPLTDVNGTHALPLTSSIQIPLPAQKIMTYQHNLGYHSGSGDQQRCWGDIPRDAGASGRGGTESTNTRPMSLHEQSRAATNTATHNGVAEHHRKESMENRRHPRIITVDEIFPQKWGFPPELDAAAEANNSNGADIFASCGHPVHGQDENDGEKTDRHKEAGVKTCADWATSNSDPTGHSMSVHQLAYRPAVRSHRIDQ